MLYVINKIRVPELVIKITILIHKYGLFSILRKYHYKVCQKQSLLKENKLIILIHLQK